jgi:hypothetical protein
MSNEIEFILTIGAIDFILNGTAPEQEVSRLLEDGEERILESGEIRLLE